MSVPTKSKEINTENDLILGYEMCDACGWKNIFQADGSELRPELISSLSWSGYVCPVCRNDQSTSRMVLSTPVPYGVLFEDEEEDTASFTVVERDDEAPRMRARHHLRALAHWSAPWDRETREMVAIASCLYLCVLLVAMLLRKWELVAALASTYWFFAKLYLVFHCLAMAGWIAIMRIHLGKGLFANLRLAWREAGEEPLFPNLQRELERRRYERRSEARVRNVHTTK